MANKSIVLIMECFLTVGHQSIMMVIPIPRSNIDPPTSVFKPIEYGLIMSSKKKAM